jgi:uncharacterized protein (DUF433 family)
MEYPHIVKTPETCAGVPQIEGTRITVNLIVAEIVRAQKTPEEVLLNHSHLSLAQIHAALAYFCDNRAEVDASLRQADGLVEELRKRFPSRLKASTAQA